MSGPGFAKLRHPPRKRGPRAAKLLRNSPGRSSPGSVELAPVGSGSSLASELSLCGPFAVLLWEGRNFHFDWWLSGAAGGLAGVFVVGLVRRGLGCGWGL